MFCVVSICVRLDSLDNAFRPTHHDRHPTPPFFGAVSVPKEHVERSADSSRFFALARPESDGAWAGVSFASRDEGAAFDKLMPEDTPPSFAAVVRSEHAAIRTAPSVGDLYAENPPPYSPPEGFVGRARSGTILPPPATAAEQSHDPPPSGASGSAETGGGGAVSGVDDPPPARLTFKNRLAVWLATVSTLKEGVYSGGFRMLEDPAACFLSVFQLADNSPEQAGAPSRACVCACVRVRVRVRV